MSRDVDALSECVSTPQQDKIPQQDKVVKYDNGATYAGQVLGEIRHGEGRWESEAGWYMGQWQADKFHGSGHQQWQDGRTFDGEFQEGLFHGTGRMEWPTKDGSMIYEGEYRNDVKHGHGRFQWPDGKVYDGQWADGFRSGEAMLISALGRKRAGRWAADKFIGWLDQDKGEVQDQSSTDHENILQN